MITLDITSAIMLYLSLALFGIFFLWVRFEKGSAFKKYSIHNQEVWVCDICAYTYVDSMHLEMSKCPQCGSWNNKEQAEEGH